MTWTDEIATTETMTEMIAKMPPMIARIPAMIAVAPFGFCW